QAAGVAGRGPWKSYPKAMLFARALSQGVRWHCPDVLGGTTAYVPEELGAQVDADGNVIDVEHRPAPARQVEAPAAPVEPEVEETAEPTLSVDDFADPAPSGDELQAAPSTADGPFQDEKPVGKAERTLTGPEAGRLHKALGAAGLPADDHHAFASAVLDGMSVSSLTQLTVSESKRVFAMAERLSRGEVEWRGGELVLPPGEDAA